MTSQKPSNTGGDFIKSLSSSKPKRIKNILYNWELYLFSLPGFVLLVIFSYVPMYGLVVAFKDYNVYKGIFNSPWVGFEHFRDLFATYEFPRIIWNTVCISILKLLFAFPVPVILALMFNEMRGRKLKSVIQTFSYLPHFLSWVVVAGIFIDLLSMNTGIVNEIIKVLGGKPRFFMGDPKYFRGVLVGSYIWKSSGWESIIYIAAMASIDQDLYQAADIDGAGRFAKMWHVTVRGISSTIITLLILKIGKLLSAGMDQVLVMYNPIVYDVADIIDTYIYRVAFDRMEFGLTTAAGLFKSVVGGFLILLANKFAKMIGESGIF